MDNPFRVKLTDICAAAPNVDAEKKARALALCSEWRLSEREELVLNFIFGPTPENILEFIDLYRTYLPYLRGEIGGDIMADRSVVDQMIVNAELLESVAFFGRLLRSIFVWNAQPQYEAVVRGITEKLASFAGDDFSFSTLSVYWAETYYRLFLLLVSDDLPLMPDKIRNDFIGSVRFFEALTLGINLDEKIGRTISRMSVPEMRAELAVNLAALLYVNNQSIGFDPDTGEPVRIGFWIDKLRIYSGKKFDGLSLINFIQDDKTFGVSKDEFNVLLIKHALMIYGHLISGYYVGLKTEIKMVEEPFTVPVVAPPLPLRSIDAKSLLDEKETALVVAPNSSSFSPARGREVEAIIKSLSFAVPSAFNNRLRAIVQARLKEVRGSDETKAMVLRSIKDGGLGLTIRQADELEEKCALAANTVSAYGVRSLKQKNTKLISHSTSTNDLPQKFIEPPPPTNAAPFNAFVHAVPHQEDQSAAASMSSNSIANIMASNATVNFTISGATKPMPLVRDVAVKPIALGPVEEINFFRLIDWRRLSDKPTESANRLKQKFLNLKEESVLLFLDAVAAWRASPLYAEYLDAINQSFAQNRPLKEINIALTDKINFADIQALINMEKELGI